MKEKTKCENCIYALVEGINVFCTANFKCEDQEDGN